jgi:hypothetical protein
MPATAARRLSIETPRPDAAGRQEWRKRIIMAKYRVSVTRALERLMDWFWSETKRGSYDTQ